MSVQSSVQSRILGSRQTALGSGDSLENIATETLDDGALCYVVASHLRFELHKDSTASPNGTTIIAPIAGPGRWIAGGGGAQGAQGSQGGTGGAGAQGAQGGAGAQGAQGASGGAGVTTPLTATLYVDAAFAGLPTGSISAPFPTIALAIAYAVSHSLSDCQFLIAPGSYTDALNIAGAVHYAFGPLVQGSFLEVFVSDINWSITNGAGLSWIGMALNQGTITFSDANSGNGEVFWSAIACNMSDQLNGNPGGAAFQHRISMSLEGYFQPEAAPEELTSHRFSMRASAIDISGYLTAGNTSLTGSVRCNVALLTGSFINTGLTLTLLQTLGSSELLNTHNGGTVTLACPTNAKVYMDGTSNYWWTHNTGNTLAGSGAAIVVY